MKLSGEAERTLEVKALPREDRKEQLQDFTLKTIISVSRLLEVGTTTVMWFPDRRKVRLLQVHLGCSGVSRSTLVESLKRKLK
jgi:hypothetical protein